jgi:hypothetical protein
MSSGKQPFGNIANATAKGAAVESAKIVGICVVCSVAYGVCHDLVTAHICVEYFTVGHPPIFGGLKDPISLAFSWVIMATWWVGILLGLPAALLARIGSRPKLNWRDLRLPIAVLILVAGVLAVISGLIGDAFAGFNAYYFPSQRIQDQPRYVAVANAHGAAYAAGIIGGLLILAWIWWKRLRAELIQLRTELGRLRRKMLS